jgi:hypothetical protein
MLATVLTPDEAELDELLLLEPPPQAASPMSGAAASGSAKRFKGTLNMWQLPCVSCG